ncbi:MAG TPA: DNA polymerase III subunit gamma/tau [Lachnoclostridium sp.]|nr:DNA polymerase III subunit gamma/tau [Lachnoclostridium sp.]
MAYTALYRKWRPKTFDEVRGQDHIVRTLKNQIQSDRIGHAYLFCGTRGTGKTSIAKIFARSVNCENPQDGNPCCTCSMCKRIEAGNSLNVVEIDAASNNGVDDVREIRNQVQYPPSEGKYRVFIIDEVHMLSAGAFNALLKTLEEPPAYVIFILATTEVNKIPVTILSRCQRYDFRRISVQTIAGHLMELAKSEGIDAEERAIRYIARVADGSMRDSLSLLDQCAAFHFDETLTYENVLDVLGAVDNSVFTRLFDAICAGDTKACLEEVAAMVDQGRELSQMVTDFIWYMRNILLIKAAGGTADGRMEEMIDVSGENAAVLSRQADAVSEDTLMRYIRVFSELSGTLRLSSQKRVLTEIAVIKLTKPQMETNLESVLQRLDTLERQMEERPAAAGIPDLGDPEKLAALAKLAAGSMGQGNGTEEKPAEPQTITLPKAEYDDLMLVRKEWPKIVSMLGRSLGSVLRDSFVKPNGESRMSILIEDGMHCQIAGTEAHLEEIRKLVADQYGKDISFSVKSRGGEMIEDTTYVTDDDLSVIHMDISEEED